MRSESFTPGSEFSSPILEPAPASAPPDPPSSDEDEGNRFRWKEFVVSSGPEGELWMARYEREGDPLRCEVNAALRLLRQRKVKEAEDLLTTVHEAIERLDAAVPGLRRVMRRWFLAARAYHCFVTHDTSAAAADLGQAEREVELAIGELRILLPLALSCVDLRRQHIRIVRSQRRWEQMRRRIDELRELMEDHRPLCRLPDGQPVYFHILVSHLLALPNLTAADRQYICTEVSDVRHRLGVFWHLTRQLYALPGQVLQYP